MSSEHVVSPEEFGIPSEAVIDLIDTLERRGLDPHALLVARRDADGWHDAVSCAWRPFDMEQPALVYSVSKTFTSLAIGLLIGEQRLTADDSVGELLGLPNPHGLTVRHLLTMNTGHSPEQIEALRFDVRALLTVPPAASPGTRFAYNSDATFALSCIVTALTGERLTDYLRPRLLDPLGIGRRWMKPARGLEQGFSGFHITVGEIARVAQLLADGGRLGERQLVPAEYIEELSRPWSDTRDPAQPENVVDDWGLGYGYQVWRSTHGFRLDGAYGQFGLVLPERGIVIAYQGSALATQQTLSAFWRFVDTIGDAPAATPAPDAVADTASRRLATLDTWSFRGTLAVDRNVDVDTTDWSLTDSEGGWTLDIPALGGVAVGSDEWAHTTVRAVALADPGGAVVESPPVEEGTHVAIAARGERDADGVLVHLVMPTSPHRMIVRADSAGAVHAGWHTVPLQGPSIATLAVPAWVIR